MSHISSKMLIASIFAGLLSTMNTWIDKIDDIRLLHLNDVFMILLMTSIMFAIMFINNLKYFCVFLIIALITFLFIRNQTFVNDKQFLKGMIPHHSMAIMMAKKIKNKTKDKKIITLANSIINNQEKEILLIKNLLNN